MIKVLSLFLILFFSLSLADSNEALAVLTQSDKITQEISQLNNLEGPFIVLIDDIQYTTSILNSININSIKKIKLYNQPDIHGQKLVDIISIITYKRSNKIKEHISLDTTFLHDHILQYLDDLSAYDYAVLLNSSYKALNGKTIFKNEKLDSRKSRIVRDGLGYFNLDFQY